MNPTIKNYCLLPVNFQLNRGQSDLGVNFLAQASGYNLLLTPAASVMVLKPSADPHIERNMQTKGFASAKSLRSAAGKQAPAAVVRLVLSGANENPQVLGLEELPGKVNYFVGNDPDKWLTDIPTYAKVKYRDVYPGIDIIYSGNEQQLELDFIVHPGTNPDLISLDFTGSEQLLLDDHGNLLLTTGGEQIRISKPVVYQESALQRSSVFGSYTLNGHQVGFRLGDYDTTKPLVIDPVIEYSTYLGGTQDDLGYGIATDSVGNVYVTGLTGSTWASNPPGFPVKDPWQSDNKGAYNAFITKIDPTGALVYSTYLGGTSGDTGWGIAVDVAGNAYVTGSTSSLDFPTANPIQSNNNSNGAGFDVFVTKLNAAGNALIYSTYLGGTQDDSGYGIAVDPAGNAYVTGYTQSSSAFPPGFPTKNPIQPDNNSVFPLNDAFVTKINADGSLGYSTYLGGSNNDIGYAIAVDSTGNAYVTGSTMSAPPNGFPITPGCFQPSFGGLADAFVTKLNADGSLGYSSYLGGGIYDEGRSIAVDSTNNTYVTGYTTSVDFPTQNPLQPSNNGDSDAFVTKISADGSSLVYSTYLGGTSEDKGYGIAVDSNRYAYVTGSTYSSGANSPPGFPLKNPLQPDNNGFNDAFITKIKPDGSGLIYSTYLGGKSYDEGNSIASNSDGNTYVTGFTFSSWTASPPGPLPGPPGFPVENPIQANTNGPWDVFVLRLAPIANLTITKSGSPNPLPLGQNLTYQITVTNNGPDPATNVVLTDTLPPDVDFIMASTGCGQTAGVVTCDLGTLAPDSSTTVTIVVKPKNAGSFTNTATVTSTQSTPVSVTITTAVFIPVFTKYTNITVKKDWQKYPPRCLK
jgi:uncharacterized repeat protein (TIGR01451 family)